MRATAQAQGWLAAQARRALGGPGRLRIVLLLGGVLALNSADIGTIGAAAEQLETGLGISHAQLGLLAAASSGVGAIAAIPMGALADRSHRVGLLAATVGTWAVAMVAGGLASDYGWLLVSRLLLGAAVAAAGPIVVSLTGDYIPPADRASVLGWILTGELIGAGAGLLAGGEIAAVLSWRYAFFLLAVASAALAWALWRHLPEPARDGAGWLPSDRPDAAEDDERSRDVIIHDIPPNQRHIAPADAQQMTLTHAFRYLLEIPSNRLLIVGSAVGYFFFAGMRTFVVVFAVRHYGVAQTSLGAVLPIIGVFALAGAVFGGRLTDRALWRGARTARVVAPAVGYAAAAVLFLPAVVTNSIVLALPLIALGSAALSAANPPLDAARLDIVPGRLWGRAESLRTLLRLAAEGVAPAIFGLLADAFARSGTSGATGLQDAFLVMLLPLFANGLILLLARRSYPVDVATAAASSRT